MPLILQCLDRYNGSMRMSNAIRGLWRSPELWIEAVRYAFAVRSLHGVDPRPDRAYIEWRSMTAYGSIDGQPTPADILAVVRWRKRWRRSVKG